MTDDKPSAGASKGVGAIVMLIVVFAAIYPLAGAAHLAYRLALAGWGS